MLNLVKQILFLTKILDLVNEYAGYEHKMLRITGSVQGYAYVKKSAFFGKGTEIKIESDADHNKLVKSISCFIPEERIEVYKNGEKYIRVETLREGYFFVLGKIMLAHDGLVMKYVDSVD